MALLQIGSILSTSTETESEEKWVPPRGAVCDVSLSSVLTLPMCTVCVCVCLCVFGVGVGVGGGHGAGFL